MKASIEQLLENLFVLESSIGGKVKYTILDPFPINSADIISIQDATKKIAEQVKQGKLNIDEINEEVFNKNIYLESEPDLIIRTSERRLSGFLLWQGSYAEVQFLPDVLWPEFTREHFIQCIEDYMNRDRRFGK